MQIMHGVSSTQFDTLWAAKHDWYEAPNYRRGGWSGVSKMLLETAVGNVDVYLKQQFRHSYRSWFNFFRKRPTALREYRNIERLQSHSIPTVDVVLFAVKGDRALLATRALDNYQSLDALPLATLTIGERRQLIRSIASCIRQLHQQRYQHNCLYPKHIFVRQTETGWSVRLIDLEKLKRRRRAITAMQHDLDTLYRRSLTLFNKHDRLVFMRSYFGAELSTSLINKFLDCP